jgi:alkylation response protein AidB-like acyl-CoA dehydrogenase
MDFALSHGQQEIKDRATEFADLQVAPYAADWDREARFPAPVFEKLTEAGFISLCVPEEYGGGGTDFLSYVLLIEELS